MNVLWQPGTDHAGIATEIIVEKQLIKEKAKFVKKYESLSSDQVILAHKQSTNRTFVKTVAHKI